MAPEQLDQIIKLATPELQERMGELHEHILDAARQALEDASDKENAKPKVVIGLQVEIGLAISPPCFRTRAGVSVRFAAEGGLEFLPDPNQPELTGLGKADTIQVGDGPKIPMKEFIAEVRKVSKRRKLEREGQELVESMP